MLCLYLMVTLLSNWLFCRQCFFNCTTFHHQHSFSNFNQKNLLPFEITSSHRGIRMWNRTRHWISECHRGQSNSKAGIILFTFIRLNNHCSKPCEAASVHISGRNSAMFSTIAVSKNTSTMLYSSLVNAIYARQTEILSFWLSVNKNIITIMELVNKVTSITSARQNKARKRYAGLHTMMCMMLSII